MTPKDLVALEQGREHAAVKVSFETERECNRRTESLCGGVEGTWPVACGKNKPRDDEQGKKDGPMGTRYKYLQGAEISD